MKYTFSNEVKMLTFIHFTLKKYANKAKKNVDFLLLPERVQYMHVQCLFFAFEYGIRMIIMFLSVSIDLFN